MPQSGKNRGELRSLLIQDTTQGHQISWIRKTLSHLPNTNDVVKQLNGEYGGNVNQGKAAYYGGDYFEKVFPRLSIIKDIKML